MSQQENVFLSVAARTWMWREVSETGDEAAGVNIERHAAFKSIS